MSREESPALADGPAVGAAPLMGAALQGFIDLHRNGATQRGARWYESMGRTVGGSEVAALLGLNPYSDLFDVIASKVALRSGVDNWKGGVACWWGTLFEDVIGLYVEADLGALVLGDSICITPPGFAGVRVSPDGYVVARFFRDGAGRLQLWTTDADPALPAIYRVLLLEFKCPASRAPCGKVPRQYRPQLLYGLEFSPVAHLGMFVDAVFRKCALGDLADTPDFDRAYHARDSRVSFPLAWGLIGVFAPALDASRSVRYGWLGESWTVGDASPDAPDADVSSAAWRIRSLSPADVGSLAASSGEDPDDSTAVGVDPDDPAVDPDDPAVDPDDPTADPDDPTVDPDDPAVDPRGRWDPAVLSVDEKGWGGGIVGDLGAASRQVFDRALGLIDRKRLPVVRGAPFFADGRGGAWDPSEAVRALRRAGPAGMALVALIPWKLFDVVYDFVPRQPGFLAEVLPLVAEVHQVVDEACAAPDPAAYVERRAAATRSAKRRGAAAAYEAAMQDLFDSCS